MPYNMTVRAEEVAASLVREYLSRKGLKRTIACMDEEHPRTDSSINNRSELRQILQIDGLYRKNKTQDYPLKSMLEIIVRSHIEGHDDWKGLNPDINQTKSTTEQSVTKSPTVTRRIKDNSRSLTGDISPSHGTLSSYESSDTHPTTTPSRIWSHSLSSENRQDRQHEPLFFDSDSSAKREPFSDRNRTGRLRRGMMTGPIASSAQESKRKHQTRWLGGHNPVLSHCEDNRNDRDRPTLVVQTQGTATGLAELSTDNTRESRTLRKQIDEDVYVDGKVGKEMHRTRRTQSINNQNVDLHMSEMILDDIDDDDEDFRQLATLSFHSSSLPQPFWDSEPMDQLTASALKELILGSSSRFSVEWMSQSLTFSDIPDLRYGIVQKKGGPCGVLASVQACVLQKLLFEETGDDAGPHSGLRPSSSTRTRCLMLAIADILWRAGDGKKATLAITSQKNNFTSPGQLRSEGVLEKITCILVDNVKDLQLLVAQHIQQFESGALGCLLLAISAILCRTIDRVKEDMDVPSTTLIGAHGYCTQELVNLLLCGRAVSNVFNNNMELDSGNGNMTLLKGISSRSNIGLLSLFEHYNICKVGSNLKTPTFPIWVVCSESHFSVLFGLQKELLSDQPVGEFDLYYYDGLASQQEEICLTVSFPGTSGIMSNSQGIDTDLVPPLEHCIRTKWKDAIVNWNDTEPIL
ncbi:hypothetical protein UPYG_G00036660 [Umbra pygmaea]|uniref:Ubiquitin carboxyl-terminal hydrolase MINDY n=1 Tax=Umbra pygmaea TaxID=75934 RepID=A0ABD0YD21_UMBPY